MSRDGFEAPNSAPWIRFWNRVISPGRHRDGGLGEVPKAGDNHRAGLADRLEGLADVLTLGDTDGDDGRVSTLAVGHRLGELGGVLHVGEGVGGAHLHGLLALELDRVDGDDVASAGVGRTLDGVDADTADAHDDHGLAGVDLGGVDRRAPAGADAATDKAGLLERQILGNLDRASRPRRASTPRRWRCRTSGRRAGPRRSSGMNRQAGSRPAGWRRGRRGSACPKRTSGSDHSRAGTTARHGRRLPSRACWGRPRGRCPRPRAHPRRGRCPTGMSPVVM